MNITLHNLRPTGTGLTGGSFLDADVFIDGKTSGFEITAGWEEHNGTWAPYGVEADLWHSNPSAATSSELAATSDAIRALDADPENFRV